MPTRKALTHLWDPALDVQLGLVIKSRARSNQTQLHDQPNLTNSSPTKVSHDTSPTIPVFKILNPEKVLS